MSDAINPSHYKHLPVEAIDIIEAAIANAPSNEAACLHWQVLKYALRCWEKQGIEDLRKAKWYLDRLIKSFDDLLAEINAPILDDQGEETDQDDHPGIKSQPDPPKRYREPTLADLANGPIKCEVRDLDGEPWKAGFLSGICDSASLRFEGKTKVGIQERWNQCRIEVQE